MCSKPLLCTIFFAFLTLVDLPVLASGSTRSSWGGGLSSLDSLPTRAASQIPCSTNAEDRCAETECISGATEVTDKTPEDGQADFLAIAQDSTNPDQWKAIKKLGNSPEGPSKNCTTLYLCLLSIANNFQHPYQLDAINELWHREDDQQTKNQEMLRPNLLLIAHNHEHPKQMMAINLLWNSDDAQRVEDQTDLYPTLRQIAQDYNHPAQWGTARFLWNLEGDQQIQDRHDLMPLLLQIAADYQNLHQWGAINLLWNTPDTHQAQNRVALCSLLKQIAQNPRHWRQQDAIKYLEKSEDPADQTLGIQLHQQYFPAHHNRSAFAVIQRRDGENIVRELKLIPWGPRVNIYLGCHTALPASPSLRRALRNDRKR